MSSSPKTRPREADEIHDDERTPKRTKVDDDHEDYPDVPMNLASDSSVHDPGQAQIAGDSVPPVEVRENLLPPSHALLNLPPAVYDQDGFRRIVEPDVGISEYVGHDVPPIEGIIKQRCAFPFTPG